MEAKKQGRTFIRPRCLPVLYAFIQALKIAPDISGVALH